MAEKLGHTWYPKDWWSSDTFFEWEDYPLLRYAYREILDLLYSNNGIAKLSIQIIKSRFRITLNESEFEILKTKFNISDDGFWTSDKVKIRLSRAESARQNGKKGGAPKGNNNASKKQPNNPEKQPKKTTQNNPRNNPNNPPLKEKEKEKEKIKEKESETLARTHTLPRPPAHDGKAFYFLKKINPERFEQEFQMRYSSKITDKKKFVEDFNDTVDLEGIDFTQKKLFARLAKYARNWIENQNKFKKPNEDNNAYPVPVG